MRPRYNGAAVYIHSPLSVNWFDLQYKKMSIGLTSVSRGDSLGKIVARNRPTSLCCRKEKSKKKMSQIYRLCISLSGLIEQMSNWWDFSSSLENGL